MVLFGLLVLVSMECGLAKGFELSKEPRRILEQFTDMRPDRRDGHGAGCIYGENRSPLVDA
jgi:hypothetical protein